jgi:CHASE3 domain sensor protein
MVKSLHEGILQRVEEGQQTLVERRRENLERQLESANEALEALRDSDSSSAGELIATYTSRIANLEASLVDLRSGVMSQVAVQSLEPVGTSRRLIMAMALVLGGLLAVMGAFFIQFVGLVRASLKGGAT